MIIVGFKPECDKSLRKKLLSFGLTPGTTFDIIRIAPLGDPVEIKVRGFLLSLRKSELELINYE
jgi:ferrous iron transport protein A